MSVRFKPNLAYFILYSVWNKLSIELQKRKVGAFAVLLTECCDK